MERFKSPKKRTKTLKNTGAKDILKEYFIVLSGQRFDLDGSEFATIKKGINDLRKTVDIERDGKRIKFNLERYDYISGEI
jgi:hypothetical protein